jgi:ApaG protein
MADLQLELGPMSDAVTNGIRVEVLSRYAAENSQPGAGEWVFQYTVRITNQGSETVQLISRHWIITDACERIREVEGPGVVGEQPVLAGRVFQVFIVVPACHADGDDARDLPDGNRGR